MNFYSPVISQTPLGKSKLTHTFTTQAGSLTSATLWNPTVTSLAAFFDCEEGDIDWRENDEGDEVVSVKGKEVGKVEWF